ncbi:hypothetical protein PC129_g6932 [Phytophthora cactorum]|uniref:Phosphatidate cytidylyltransferase n=2 Tax=Phytophthora cactorum TaxID=29920 RepID=A0A8T1CWA9_9STRA|nr:hypothetical protein Pcac1_g5908 [Phytophthora cactorum]KAG2896049.1 hypothetical protein PC114_g15268 [Phytophthora cactorum]KAG2930246.1 hypothetical protein PC117_g13748 [Phytophthora cactorum]KAG3023870.1 hypothetical protein PC119_g8751 [Phytophthora cactorum]KAG3078008.1 hypothetical protein PC122_g12890 [Phytophthora cactorum]
MQCNALRRCPGVTCDGIFVAIARVHNDNRVQLRTSVCSYEYACLANRIRLRARQTLEQLSNNSETACGEEGNDSGSQDATEEPQTQEEIAQRRAVTSLPAAFCAAVILCTVSSTAFLLAVQWLQILQSTEFHDYRWEFAVITGFIAGFCACMAPDWKVAVVTLINYFIFILLTPLVQRSSRTDAEAFVTFMLVTLGLVYVVGPLSVLVAFVDDNNRSLYRKLLIALLYVVWASDTGVYVVGKTLAYPYYHPLAPHLSKN